MMQGNSTTLLNTLLLSTSPINVLKTSKEQAKRRYAKNTIVGLVILCIVFLIYGAMLSIGIAKAGQAEILPELCAMIVLAMTFLFTLFKASGYLFGFKEYDMIMSMPFSVKSVVASRFWYMYIKSMPMYLAISLAMLIGYGVGGCLSVLSCIIWIVLSLVLPVGPMVIATALGAIAVKIGARFRHKSVVQAVLKLVFILPIFFSKFFFDNNMNSDELDALMKSIADGVHRSSSYMPVARWFANAINKIDVIAFVLVILSATVVYEVFFIIISKFYRRINSQLSVGENNRKFKLTNQKQQSMVKSIAFKEYKRMTGSSVYLLNVGFGQIMVTIMGIVMLFVKPEIIIDKMLQGAPLEATLVFPAIPILFYFFLGMVPTTACSPSLEGKNYWIMQTLPIRQEEDKQGKILFNLYITLPFAAFGTIAASICFRVSVIDALASVLAICSLCVFSTINGLRSGLKHRRLDWENEIEVIKQGMAVTMYIIPHIISGIVLMPLVVVANYYLHSVTIIMLILTVITWGLIAILKPKNMGKYS